MTFIGFQQSFLQLFFAKVKKKKESFPHGCLKNTETHTTNMSIKMLIGISERRSTQLVSVGSCDESHHVAVSPKEMRMLIVLG